VILREHRNILLFIGSIYIHTLLEKLYVLKKKPIGTISKKPWEYFAATKNSIHEKEEQEPRNAH